MKQAGLVFLFFIIFSVSGCATCKNKDLEIQGLKNEISVLASQSQNKEEEINNLKQALIKSEQEKEALSQRITDKESGCEVKSRPNIKQIQIALKNAGYNPGAVDGRMGRQTKDAIKLFQKNNDLRADGRVGKKTWKLLCPYLYKKVK